MSENAPRTIAVTLLGAGLLAVLAAAPAPAAPSADLAADSCAARAIKPAALVEAVRAQGQQFPVGNLLLAEREIDAKARGVAPELARESVLHRPNLVAVERFLRRAPAAFTLPVEVSGGRVELELVRVDVTTADFAVVTSESNGRAVPYEPGLHYRGKIKGDPDSHAAVSVFRDEVMGSYFTPGEGTVVIGRLLGDNPRGEHIVYPSRVIDAHNDWTCATADDAGEEGPSRPGSPRNPSAAASFDFLTSPAVAAAETEDKALVKCVRIYVETDFDMYQNKGSVSAVTNYVTGFFNQSAVLYANESIPITLSQVFVWSSNDPYSGSNSSTMLSQFQANRNSFNGDIGHLVAFHGNGGIAAGFNGFCNSNIDNRQCFSGVNTSYSNVPTYSWTVQVFTHEMGHLFGSRHTHACVWNGNNTAIDGCSTPEGTCSRPGLPSGGGTIMSYCHLSGNPGINFNNGFGPQPGNTIRSRFNAASCLGTCDDGGGGGGCSGGTTYTGSLSGTGDQDYHPNGTYYRSNNSGTHSGTLSGPGGADFDLYLQKWNGSSWSIVARGEGPTSTENVSYNGTAGYYRWRVYSYSGSGSYSLCLKRPS
jgi:hypothetical protein